MNAIKEIKKELIYYEGKPVKRKESWNNMITYNFVISPLQKKNADKSNFMDL
jgi:hypothetical protein